MDAAAATAADAASTQPANLRFAFVTLVTSDGYVDGALVLLHSLRRTLTPYSIVCLATPNTLSEGSMKRLRQHFDGVIETDVRLSSDDRGLDLLGRPDLRSTLTKIQLWDPALFGAWDALCYMDADTLVRKPIDDIFSRYSTWREDCPQWREGGLAAASPDTGWPDCFNSGVLLLAPGYGCYQDLVRRTSSLSPSFDGADQGLLNEHFSDWSTAPPYRRLPFLYNSTANIYYTYRPALERFGHEVRVVHFIGVSKPWNWERTPGGHLLADSSTPERWRQLINLWWNIHDDCVSGWKFWRGPFSKSIAFGAGYHHVTEPPIPAPESVCQQAQYSGSNRDLISLVPTADTDGGHRHYHHRQEQHEHGQGQHVREVPDWDKDWSWADDRVHPLDYAYLKAHHVSTSQMHNPHQHSYEQQEQQQQQQQQRHHQDHHDHHDHHNHHHRHHDDNANSGNNSSWAPDYHEHHSEQKDYQEHSNNASQQDHGFGVSSNGNNRHYDHSHSEHFHDQSHSSHHDNGHSHGGPQEVHQHAQAASEPTPPHPAWMQSQRPWEDVAREGWLHHDEYKPHTYDQSYIERRIADYSHNHHYDDNNGYTHHGYDHGGADQGHSDHHDGHGGDGSYHQPWAEHQHHEHGNSEHRGWNHPVWYGHSDQSQQYRPVPLPNDRPLYEASQVVLQPHDPGHGGYRDGNADPHGQYHHHSHGHDDGDNDGNQHFAQSSSARSSRSNTGSSPIYYPQPKSPMVVNPVALWESSEEQARRRAWAQHVRAPLGEHQRQADSAASIFGGPDGQIADQQVPPSSIDHIDSSQLPHETPWKISHVRQRLLNNDATSANAPSAARTGMQFKEGVANDGNARDAAGQLLQRWNEAVISRNIGPRFGEVSSDQISHSVPRLERGTDAIRLETTVSCEAEDSKGERTVYRFTLSSTLDVGGAQGTSPSAAAVSMQPSQAQQPQISSRVTQISKQPSHHFGDSGPGDDYNDENDDHSMVVDLRQPLNYQEPAMSRRSSFVQLPPAATSRSAQMAARGGSDNRDQFAVADARYWKLQRQLIDLEMSQRRLESSQRGGKEPMAGSPGRTASIGGWEAQGVDAAELASPPTPTRKPTSLGVEPQGSRRLVRRSSAFSIADPAMVLGSQELAEANSTRDVDTSALDSSQGRGGDRDRDKSTSRSRSSPRLAALAASEQAKARDFASKPEAGPSSGSGVPIAEAGAMLPSQPKRSRSHSALLRIATENRAQAVSSTLGAGVPTREQESTGQKPIAVLLGAPLQKADDSMTRADGEPGNSDEDSGAEDRDFKSAIGRKPTPFPRSLLSKKGKDSDLLDEVEESETGSQIMRVKEKHTVDMQSGGIGQRRAAPHSLTIDPAPSGFEPSHYDVSSVSSGTPMTPSRQKIRPLINWGDEDGNDTAPPDDDMSLSAQWLRIVNGAPPPRAPVAPAKAQLTKDGQQAALNAAAAKKASETAAADTRERVVAVAEEIDTGDSSTEKRDYSSAKDSAVLTTATAEDGEDTAGSAEAKAVSKEQLAEQSGDDQRKANPAAAATPTPAETKPAAAGTRAPPRKLHSTKSFLNLTSKVYDTVSDSEMDPSELELQERFWARAMRPPKSGTSTPYTPGRRKSVVEMSSAISPRDLEEWMQWQGEGMLAIGRRSDLDPDRAEEPENQDASHSAENMITPPVSKERDTGATSAAPDDAAVAAKEGSDSEGADDADIEDIGDDQDQREDDKDRDGYCYESDVGDDDDDKLEMRFSHKTVCSDYNSTMTHHPAQLLDANTIDARGSGRLEEVGDISTGCAEVSSNVVQSI